MTVRRRALSLVEVLLAVVILALTAVALYGTLSASVRGVTNDRLTEAKRAVTQDLLERFAHRASDLPALWPPSATPPAGAPRERMLTVDEALRFTALPPEAAAALSRTLATGGVTGFKLVWYPGVAAEPGGGPRAQRLDVVWCIPALTGTSPGPRVDSFRVFALRGGS